METREKSSTQQIVPAPPQALAVRSAALVARGLRDLARDSNWLIKKVFNARSSQLSISAAGELCALSPLIRHGGERIALYDIERGVPTLSLLVPGEPDVCPPGLPAAFAWSPTVRYLVAAWGGWMPELHVFDLQGKSFLDSFGEFKNFPSSMSWSDTGNFFAAASRGGGESGLRLWQRSSQPSSVMPFSGKPVAELTAPNPKDNWLETETVDADSGDPGAFSGFGRTAFSPDESALACAVEIEGEWADDSIALLELPAMRRRKIIPAQGHVTDIGWTPDSRQLVFCAAGQAYRLVRGSAAAAPEALPFGAELCACHPRLPFCLCYSSWLKNSAKGRLILVDLGRLTVFDEYAAEGVVDLRWSLDGSKAYAVTADGLAYIYEPPLL